MGCKVAPCNTPRMNIKLGGPIKDFGLDPERWVSEARVLGYTASYAPVNHEHSGDVAAAFARAAAKAGIVIAESGAWSNPIDPDSEKASKAISYCQQQLACAEDLGARCCVNIAGSRNPEQWDGPHPENFSRETFDLIVESVRKIIDAVKPVRTRYALETMPWIFPSSPDEYLELLKAIDRPGFAVHLDPVNMINSPARAYNNGAFIRECFEKLGPWIRSCHAKDITLQPHLTVHLDECRPGTGILDYATFLSCASGLGADVPVMLEHLAYEEYPAALDFLSSKVKEMNLP